MNNRYDCCFGPQDHSNVVPEDVQAILDSTVKKKKQGTFNVSGKRRGKKVVPEYDVFPTTQPSQAKRKRVGKTQTGRSIKRGCQCCFFAKQLYQDPTICQIIYRSSNHTNKEGHVVHGVSVAGFKDSLGSALSTEMKAHLTNLLWLGLSPSQVMAQHKAFVKNLAAENGDVNRDTFVQAQDVRNLAKTRDKALWQRHDSDPTSVKMWVDENPNDVFCYREHGKLDLNRKKQDDTPFTLGIQTQWQVEMLIKCGHNSAISIDATFGTSETRVFHPLSPITTWNLICIHEYLNLQHCLR